MPVYDYTSAECKYIVLYVVTFARDHITVSEQVTCERVNKLGFEYENKTGVVKVYILYLYEFADQLWDTMNNNIKVDHVSICNSNLDA